MIWLVINDEKKETHQVSRLSHESKGKRKIMWELGKGWGVVRGEVREEVRRVGV